MSKNRGQIDREAARRIREHLAKYPDEDMVVKVRNGVIGKIYRKSTDRKMSETAKKNEIWKSKKARREETPDPLGAVPGSVLMPIIRENMYE